MVRLSSYQPQVGRALTATVSESLDGVDEVTEWCWERSLLPTFPLADTHEITCTSTNLTTTATYTPVDDDRRHYLRATATYTDRQGTSKDVAKVTDSSVPAPPTIPPSRGTGGGSGGGGGGGSGGGSACTEDLHGNTSTQATDMALSTLTAGAICPAVDVDYFTVTAPGRGLVFVDTFGSVPTRGTLWQDGAVLASGPTGRRQNDRLGARVQAGLVVVAVQGQGGATGPYEVVVTFVRGYLENPGPISRFRVGWGCCRAGCVRRRWWRSS